MFTKNLYVYSFVQTFNSSFRYDDDVLSPNNSPFGDYLFLK